MYKKEGVSPRNAAAMLVKEWMRYAVRTSCQKGESWERSPHEDARALPVVWLSKENPKRLLIVFTGSL
jgi:hypothetical protein